jgi:hypothetical protein
MFSLFMMVLAFNTSEGLVVKNIPYTSMEECQKELVLANRIIQEEQMFAGGTCTEVVLTNNM